jgi:hypothetical protein
LFSPQPFLSAQALFPMTHSPGVAEAAALGVADTMEVELTTVVGPFTQDVTTL